VIDDDVAAQMKQFGWTDEAVAETQKTAEQKAEAMPDFEVWDCNWLSFQFFLGVSTQWNIAAGMGGIFYICMPRNCIESEMNMRGIQKLQRIQILNDINIIEHAALAVLNKAKDK
jgi:hypothetical protein